MKNKKLYLILFFAAILLIVAAFLIFNFINRNPQSAKVNEAVNNELPKDLKIERQNDLLNFTKAQEAQNLNLCGPIKDEQFKNSCIQEIALKSQATSSCLTISDEQVKSNCSALILLNRAELSQNLSDCFLIEPTMFKKTCVEKIAAANKKIDCNLIQDSNPKNTCLSIIYYQQAKDENNFKICQQIPELIRRANCLAELQKIDLHSDIDKDGLDFLQEILNNTNPDNPDTDGDGFKDGEEIKSGFNPDGEGVINEVKTNSLSCSNIMDKSIKAICLSELNDQPLDLLKCRELKSQKLKDFCLNVLKLTGAVK